MTHWKGNGKTTWEGFEYKLQSVSVNAHLPHDRSSLKHAIHKRALFVRAATAAIRKSISHFHDFVFFFPSCFQKFMMAMVIACLLTRKVLASLSILLISAVYFLSCS